MVPGMFIDHARTAYTCMMYTTNICADQWERVNICSVESELRPPWGDTDFPSPKILSFEAGNRGSLYLHLLQKYSPVTPATGRLLGAILHVQNKFRHKKFEKKTL